MFAYNYYTDERVIFQHSTHAWLNRLYYSMHGDLRCHGCSNREGIALFLELTTYTTEVRIYIVSLVYVQVMVVYDSQCAFVCVCLQFVCVCV